MAFTLAEHARSPRRRRRVERTMHVGVLVCSGTYSAGNAGVVAALTRADLTRAARMIREDLLAIYRPFSIADSGWEVNYTFAFDVVSSSSDAPVQSTGIQHDVEVSPGADLRAPRSALLEAYQFELENIAIVVPHLSGASHGPYVPPVRDEQPRQPPNREQRERQLGAHGALLPRASNTMLLEYERDIASRVHTPAHETGHMLGLTNARDRASIMGPNNTQGQARARRLTPQDQSYLHGAVQLPIPGMRRPAYAQTSGTQAPYRFDGAHTHGEL